MPGGRDLSVSGFGSGAFQGGSFCSIYSRMEAAAGSQSRAALHGYLANAARIKYPIALLRGISGMGLVFQPEYIYQKCGLELLFC